MIQFYISLGKTFYKKICIKIIFNIQYVKQINKHTLFESGRIAWNYIDTSH